MGDIISIARAWIGTPYVHQAAHRGVGCDCLGLLRGVWAELSGSALIAVPPYTPDWSEPQGKEVLWQGLLQRLINKSRDDVEAGDIMLFRMRHGSVAKHVGVQAETGSHVTFIHAYQGHGVRESTFSTPWQRRLVARFSIPERD